MITRSNQQVTVNRLALLATLKDHRAQYQTKYAESIEEFRYAVLARHAQVGERLAQGDFSSFGIHIQVPTDYTSEYDDIIDMLEFSVDETVTLDRSAFRAYIKDEWGWSDGVIRSICEYKSISGRM